MQLHLSLTNLTVHVDSNITISLSSFQIQQFLDPDRRDPRLHICNGGSASGDGDVERVPSRTASSLGGVSEQVLRRRWLQVCSLHFHSPRKRRRVSE